MNSYTIECTPAEKFHLLRLFKRSVNEFSVLGETYGNLCQCLRIILKYETRLVKQNAATVNVKRKMKFDPAELEFIVMRLCKWRPENVDQYDIEILRLFYNASDRQGAEMLMTWYNLKFKQPKNASA